MIKFKSGATIDYIETENTSLKGCLNSYFYGYLSYQELNQIILDSIPYGYIDDNI